MSQCVLVVQELTMVVAKRVTGQDVYSMHLMGGDYVKSA